VGTEVGLCLPRVSNGGLLTVTIKWCGCFERLWFARVRCQVIQKGSAAETRRVHNPTSIGKALVVFVTEQM
jgi:hypothetical protein